MLFERQCPGCGKPAPAVCAGCVDGLTADEMEEIAGLVATMTEGTTG